MDKELKTLYVKIHKSLYGLLHSEILFYLKTSNRLENNGFIINPYDICVSKKLVKRGEITTVCHVDDQKVLHTEKFEVTKFSQ